MKFYTLVIAVLIELMILCSTPVRASGLSPTFEVLSGCSAEIATDKPWTKDCIVKIHNLSCPRAIGIHKNGDEILSDIKETLSDSDTPDAHGYIAAKWVVKAGSAPVYFDGRWDRVTFSGGYFGGDPAAGLSSIDCDRLKRVNHDEIRYQASSDSLIYANLPSTFHEYLDASTGHTQIFNFFRFECMNSESSNYLVCIHTYSSLD
ncbi:hypothetical protein [Endozoicomonas sp. YOMI1]|uniref:hypothetical protein n=1 Tax=Endozoicomonas sp. YOMI1 TaxID=2828739 RepID=UPI002147F4D7|nr:hypothetical protein [Endozoicomonas sp. YOMI1]